MLKSFVRAFLYKYRDMLFLNFLIGSLSYPSILVHLLGDHDVSKTRFDQLVEFAAQKKSLN